MINKIIHVAVYLFVAAFFTGSAVAASDTSPLLPSKAKFQLVLSKPILGSKCPPFMKNIRVVVGYNYNFRKNMGIAYLYQIGRTKVNIKLHPLGLKGEYAFMSDIEPLFVKIRGKNLSVKEAVFLRRLREKL